MGHLKVIFDDNGVVKSYEGNPILLNGSFAEDPVVLALVHEMDDRIVKARTVRALLTVSPALYPYFLYV